MPKFQKYREKGQKKAKAKAKAKAKPVDARIHFPSPTGKRGRPRIDQPLCGLV